jgi:hypothetical protein
MSHLFVVLDVDQLMLVKLQLKSFSIHQLTIFPTNNPSKDKINIFQKFKLSLLVESVQVFRHHREKISNIDKKHQYHNHHL